MLTRAVSLVTLVSAARTITAECAGVRPSAHVFKPLMTSSILPLAVTAPAKTGPFYRTAIIAGLAFSLAGGVFLILPADLFVTGLASFLLAHCCYIAAFTSTTGLRSSALLALPFVISDSALAYNRLVSRIPKRKRRGVECLLRRAVAYRALDWCRLLHRRAAW